MSPPAAPEALEVVHDGVTLRGEVAGEGPGVLLLHGLTATRRYVVHGSRLLERAGFRVAQYDARGHGESSPAPARDAYGYDRLAADAVAVLDALGMERAALIGQSMGSATAVAVALRHPDRVRALAIITPAHRGVPSPNLDYWDGLAAGLERGGPEGFLEAMPLAVGDRWRDTIRTVILQRLGRHADPGAVADALRATPRSAAFDGMEALGRLAVPTVVVGSRDDVDPDHPLAVAEEYTARIPGSRLIVEDAGESPLAWRGGALSRALQPLLEQTS